MKLADVMDEVAKAISTITGLSVFAYPPATVTGPAGYVSYPESVDYDETYQRGQDQFTGLPITLLVGKPTEKSSRDVAAEWANGSGPKSVKAAVEAFRWTSCDDVTIISCGFDIETIAGVEYLAVTFRATAVGQGED